MPRFHFDWPRKNGWAEEVQEEDGVGTSSEGELQADATVLFWNRQEGGFETDAMGLGGAVSAVR